MENETEPQNAETASSDEPAHETVPDTTGEHRFRLGNQGMWLCVALLVANLVIYFGASGLAARSMIFAETWRGQAYNISLTGAAQTIYFAPLLLATALAAWGPWKAWRRLAVYAIALALLEVGRIKWETHLGSLLRPWSDRAGIEMVHSTFQMLNVFLPATFCLVLFGSWLRLRIGPREMPPVRVTILSVMLATGILALLVTATASAQQAYFRHYARIAPYGERFDADRVVVMTRAAVVGPCVALVVGCIVASAYRWWARVAVVVLFGCYFGLMYYSISQSAPQFPGGQPNFLTWLYSGMLIGVTAGVVWIVLCIRLLDRSGWPCSRRTGARARG